MTISSGVGRPSRTHALPVSSGLRLLVVLRCATPGMVARLRCADSRARPRDWSRRSSAEASGQGAGRPAVRLSLVSGRIGGADRSSGSGQGGRAGRSRAVRRRAERRLRVRRAVQQAARHERTPPGRGCAPEVLCGPEMSWGIRCAARGAGERVEPVRTRRRRQLLRAVRCPRGSTARRTASGNRRRAVRVVRHAYRARGRLHDPRGHRPGRRVQRRASGAGRAAAAEARGGLLGARPLRAVARSTRSSRSADLLGGEPVGGVLAEQALDDRRPARPPAAAGSAPG